MRLLKKWFLRGTLVAMGGGFIAAAIARPELKHSVYGLGREALVFLRLETPIEKGSTFWCPMHPDIRRKAPGACPI